MRAHLEASQGVLEGAWGSADLSAPRASPLGTKALGELLDFFGWHEAYHAGQLVLLRRIAQNEAAHAE